MGWVGIRRKTMTNPNNGGPAFPQIKEYNGQGMALRDYFAGQALAGLLAESMHDCGPSGIAQDCYLHADAMLRAREE
jgi:hypothetical protein